jgi:hypothetical protein
MLLPVLRVGKIVLCGSWFLEFGGGGAIICGFVCFVIATA